MSTNYIDNTVVSMKFDNRDFERNVHQSLGTIDKLKKSLDFKGAADSMEELSDTVEKTDLSPLLKGLSKATDGFSALEVMGITALSRITDKAMDVGEKLVKSLTIDQLSAGWSKYEQKINAVQTIMAATASTWDATAKRLNFAGTQMEFVNEQLDKLNWFSDETSYSFTDMTSNIGKFTSAGVDLDKAVTAMEGISVWAAKSGVNAQNATRAYYNLAQAMSVGAVKQIDWRSIENVNMATIEFKQTAIDTAVKMGTLKKASNGVFKTLKGGEVTVTNFSDRLKDQWLSADVLTATLEEYGKAAVRLSEISDEYDITATQFLNGIEDWQEGNRDITGIANELGISVEELLPLFEELSSEEYKLSLSAFKAAQEAKTFTEVIEATKDAVSTQWMNTWELIFGNYEEAKALWSEMAEKFFEIFAGGGELRNNMLKKLLSDNWDALIQRINDAGIATDEFEKKLEENMRNGGVPVDDLLNTWGSLAEVFRNWPGLSHYVRETLLEMITPLDENGKAVAETTKKLEDFQKVVNEVIRGDYKSGKARVENLTKAGWDYAEVQDLVNKVWARNGQTWKDTTITAEDLVDTLGKMTEEELKTIGFTDREVELLQDLQDELLEADSDINTFIDNLSNKSGRTLIFESLINIIDAFALAINVVKDAWNEVFPQKNIKTLRRYLEIIHSITEWLKMDKDTYDKVKRTLMGIFSVMGLIQDVITTALKIILPDLFTGIENVGGGILDVTANLGDFLVKLRKFLTGGELLGNIIKYLRDMFFASVDGIKAFIEYLSELPIVGAVLEKIRDVLDKIVGFFKELWDIFYDSIIEENKTVFEAIVKVFERLAKAFKDLEEKYPILKDIKEAISNFFNAFKDYGGDILNGLIEGLSGFNLKELKDKVVELAEAIYNTFADWMGIHSPATKFIELALNCIAGFVVGIIEGTIFAVNAIRSFAKEVYDSTNKYIVENPDSPMAKLQRYIQNSFIGIRDFFAGILDGIRKIVKNIGDYLEDNELLAKLGKILYGMMGILLLASWIYKNIAMASAIREIGDAIGSMGDFFASWSLKNYATIARNLTIAITLIGIIVYLLAQLPQEQFAQAMTALQRFAVLSILLGSIIGLLTWLNSKFSKAKKVKNKKTGGDAWGVLQIASLILSIGAAVYLITEAINEVQNMLKDGIGQFTFGITFVSIIATALFLVARYLSKIATNAPSTNLIGVAAVIGVIAMSIGSILKNIYKYFIKEDEKGNVLINLRDHWPEYLAGLGSLVLLIMVMAEAAKEIASAGKGGAIFGVATAVIGISLGVLVLTKAFKSLSDAILDIKDRTWDYKELILTFAASLMVVAAAVFTLVASVLLISKEMKKNPEAIGGLFTAAIFIMALTGAVFALIECIRVADDVIADVNHPFKSILLVIGALASIVGSVFLISKWSSPNTGKALGTLFGLAIVIGALGAVIYALGTLENRKWGDIVAIGATVGGAISVMLILLGKCNALSSEGYDITKTVEKLGQLIVLAGVIGIFGYAVYELTKLGKTDEVVGIIWSLGGVMVALLAVVAILQHVQNKMGDGGATYAVAATIASLGWAIGELAKGIAALITALASDPAWGDKLLGVWMFLTAVLLIIGAFIGVLPQFLKGQEATLLAIAAVVAAIGVFILALAALLAAITYFVENETLTKIFSTIFGWISKIVTWLEKAIKLLGDFFGLYNDKGKTPIELANDYVKQAKEKGDLPRADEYDYIASGAAAWFEEDSKKAAQKYKDKQLVESGALNPNRSSSRPIGPNDTRSNRSTSSEEENIYKSEVFYNKVYMAAPEHAIQEVSLSTKSVKDVAGAVADNPVIQTAGKFNTYLGNVGMYGIQNGSAGIFGIPQKIVDTMESVETVEKFMNLYQSGALNGLSDVDYKKIVEEVKSGNISEETMNQMIGIFGNLGGEAGANFGEMFNFNTEEYLSQFYSSAELEDMMNQWGLDMGSIYGSGFFTGFTNSAEEEPGAEALLKVNSMLGLAGVANPLDSIMPDVSAYPNYGIFGGYGDYGFGTQTVEFPDKMTVEAPTVVEAITLQISRLSNQVAGLKNDINNIYVRLDGTAIVGKLTPSISNEIYGRVMNTLRGN